MKKKVGKVLLVTEEWEHLLALLDQAKEKYAKEEGEAFSPLFMQIDRTIGRLMDEEVEMEKIEEKLEERRETTEPQV